MHTVTHLQGSHLLGGWVETNPKNYMLCPNLCYSFPAPGNNCDASQNSTHFECKDYYTGKLACFPNDYKCDYVQDCWNNEDEPLDCPGNLGEIDVFFFLKT